MTYTIGGSITWHILVQIIQKHKVIRSFVVSSFVSFMINKTVEYGLRKIHELFMKNLLILNEFM